MRRGTRVSTCLGGVLLAAGLLGCSSIDVVTPPRAGWIGGLSIGCGPLAHDR